MRVPETIRVDASAYGILEKYRKQLVKKGQSGASFSDAVRHMETQIRQ